MYFVLLFYLLAHRLAVRISLPFYITNFLSHLSSFQVLKESFHPQVAPRVREWLNEADGEGMGPNN